MKTKIKYHAQKAARLHSKVEALKAEVDSTMKALHKVKASRVEDIVKLLPDEQKPLVQACFNAARFHNKKNRRYATDYIYDCMIMRIKAPALYEKLRSENKLALPSKRTLQRYMSALKPAYGFQENTFTMLASKGESMKEGEKHGAILIDEMALDSRTYFDKNECKVRGLVDLGGFEAEEDRGKRGDHALVVMFQPFKGRWVQALGAFLSAGAVKSDKLHKIIIEATALVEKSGFFVDAVVTDGATWNRSMWDLFGIDALKPSCEHPVDGSRELRFASDFPHLIKSLWSRVLDKKKLNLPEGKIKLDHWWAVFHEESKKGIKGVYTLERDHLEPTHYQKMKVRLAMQFFGERVADAMQHYKEKGNPTLQDDGPTIAFIRRINALVDAMNSQIPSEALKPDPDSRHHRTLFEFLKYLKEMNEISKQKHEKIAQARQAEGKRKKKARQTGKPYVGLDDEITSSVWLGLMVTIQNAISLVCYLADECNYLYFLTRRLNQDALEHFFGHIRGACGANQHPDPLMFINIYRLLMTYSLIKPPRGSNVSGGQVLETLIKLKDSQRDKNSEARAALEEKIDQLLDQEVMIPAELEMEDSDQLSATIDPYALTVFAGYVARKLRGMRPAKDCLECNALLCITPGSASLERESLLMIRTHGGLLRPSQQLFDLVVKLEEAVIKTSSTSALHSSMIFTVLDELLSSTSGFPLIGCEDHARGLTTSLVSFYLNTRMHFVCAEADKAVNESKRRKRNMAKVARLATSTAKTN